MELEVPLYCETQEGDCLFDWYTVMSEDQKKVFIALARKHLEREISKLEALVSRLKGEMAI